MVRILTVEDSDATSVNYTTCFSAKLQPSQHKHNICVNKDVYVNAVYSNHQLVKLVK